MPRVAGCDPGTSSLDVLVLDDGAVADQVRFTSDQLRAAPAAPVAWLRDRGPFDLIAGPSGYGLPLVRAADCTDAQLALMSLVRPDERKSAKGVGGFSAVARAFRDSGLPVVFLPGVIHLPSVPAHRKLNKIDLGTSDKLCVAALCLAAERAARRRPFALVEAGSAFTACLAVSAGHAVTDGVGGTAGPLGGRSAGGWDGELAYLLGPLRKADLFEGGLSAVVPELAAVAFAEAVAKAVLGLVPAVGRGLHVTFPVVYLSGSLFDARPDLRRAVARRLGPLLAAEVKALQSPFPGVDVKAAAQGAAVIADGLAGGRYKALVRRLRLREAAGTVLDWLVHPRADDVRRQFLGDP